jgi:hypothetical protein
MSAHHCDFSVDLEQLVPAIWQSWECDAVAQRLNMRDTPEDITDLTIWLNSVTCGHSKILP